MQQRVQLLQVVTVDPQQIVCLAGHGPGGGDLRPTGHKAGKAGGIVGPVAVQVNLHKTLHGKAKLPGVEAGHIALDEALGLQTLTPPPGLTGGEVEGLAKFLRSGLSVLLQMCEQFNVGGVKHA